MTMAKTDQAAQNQPTIREWDVLLIEPDDETCRILTESCLENLRALRVTTAQEGDEKLRRTNFRLIICADELPDTPGLMLLAQTMDLWPSTQRILMCRDLDSDLFLHALREGSVVHYLPKPLDPEATSHLIKYAVDQNHVMENLLMTRRLLDEAQARLANEHPPGSLAGEFRRGAFGSLLWAAFMMVMAITIVLVGFASFYLLKSAVGIDFFPDKHLEDIITE